MTTTPAKLCTIALCATLRRSERAEVLDNLSSQEAKRLLEDWLFLARPEQRAPDGDWRTWIFLGGRGAGKTRAGAEWVARRAREGLSQRIALIAPTMHDAREVMIEGPSGILSLNGERPAFEVSRRRLTWRNGAVAEFFSAEDPPSLRGPQFDAAWCDELCYWKDPEEVLHTLAHALRIGRAPPLLVTTTARPVKALKRLIEAPDTVLTHSGTLDNRANLSAEFVAALHDRWTGSVRDRQELMGELIDDPPGALWSREMVAAAREGAWRRAERVIVAIDPPVGVGLGVDACGVIAAGAYQDGTVRRAVVLADGTTQGLAPHQWAERAVVLARAVGASEIVAEANNGGELVRAVLALAAPDLPIRLVRARMGKYERAAPVATYYSQGRVKHAAHFAELEDEMCAFGAQGFTGSPDRLDALVWALTELMDGGAGPLITSL